MLGSLVDERIANIYLVHMTQNFLCVKTLLFDQVKDFINNRRTYSVVYKSYTKKEKPTKYGSLQ